MAASPPAGDVAGSAISRISLTQTAPAGFAEGQADFGPSPRAEPPAADPALRRQAASLGMENHVRFVGYLPRDGALRDCYAAADVFTFASHTYADFHLLMPLYICRRWDGEVTAREGQQLAWVRANKLRDYEMPPADIPLIPHLIDLLM